MLGTFHGTAHFQLLSGLYIGRQEELYWTIFFTLTCLISLASLICVTGKKIKEKYKDKILLKNINVQIQNQPVQEEFDTISMFNNVKNNVPLLNGFQIMLTVGIAFSIALVFIVHSFVIQDDINHPWINSIYLELVVNIIYKLVIPIIYLAKRRDVRKFIQDTYFK